MSVQQLRTRLGKITDYTKLQNFIVMADNFTFDNSFNRDGSILRDGYRELALEARQKIMRLYGNIPSQPPPSGPRNAWRRAIASNTWPERRRENQIVATSTAIPVHAQAVPILMPAPEVRSTPKEKPVRFIMIDKKGEHE